LKVPFQSPQQQRGVAVIPAYRHLNAQQRYTIHVMRKNKCSCRTIAKFIGVSPSTVCRELKRNQSAWGYQHDVAERFAACIGDVPMHWHALGTFPCIGHALGTFQWHALGTFLAGVKGDVPGVKGDVPIIGVKGDVPIIWSQRGGVKGDVPESKGTFPSQRGRSRVKGESQRGRSESQRGRSNYLTELQ